VEWINETEKNGFELLGHLQRYFSVMGLHDTQDAISLLKRRKEMGKIDWDLLDEIRELFSLEICQEHPECKQSYELLHDLIIEITTTIKKGRTWRMLGGCWNINQIEENGQLQKIILGKGEASHDDHIKCLLAGLSILIKKEREEAFLRTSIHSWTRCINYTKPEVEDKVQDYLTVYEKFDGKAEVTHIRNAFAHAHFLLVDDGKIELWDIHDGRETYRKTFDYQELIFYINAYEYKLVLFELFTFLSVAIGNIYCSHGKT
jgi:hypothetical protein